MSKTTIVGVGVRRGEGLAVGGDERVDARLDAGEEARVGDDRVAQAVAVDGTADDRLRGEVGDGGGTGAALGVEPVHRGVGVPDRHAGLGEEPGGGGLAHADRAGQAETVGPAHGASTAARSASSTSGRTPNQRSKPGAAWCRSIPRPSTATRPSRRASATKGVGSPP